MTTSSEGNSRFVLGLGTAAALLFFVSPALSFLGVLSPFVGFRLFGLGGLLGVATVLAGVVAGFRRGWGRARNGLVLGLIVSLAFLYVALPGRDFPVINDISTSLKDPPQFIHARTLEANRGRDMGYPGESFARQQRAGYPDLGPLRLDVPPDEAFRLVQERASGMEGWQVTHTDPSARALEGVATSKLFRFRDDFVIEVRIEDNRTTVHMRSKSRDGRGDIGANAARIRAFFSTLN